MSQTLKSNFLVITFLLTRSESAVLHLVVARRADGARNLRAELADGLGGAWSDTGIDAAALSGRHLLALVVGVHVLRAELGPAASSGRVHATAVAVPLVVHAY